MNKVLCVLRVNGIDCPVYNLLDIDGDELSDAATVDMAFMAVAQLPDGKWLATEVDHYDLRALQ